MILKEIISLLIVGTAMQLCLINQT